MVQQKTDTTLKRPNIGIGVMILNEFDEVLVSQRLAKKEGDPFANTWAFPGGWQEYGEEFV